MTVRRQRRALLLGASLALTAVALAGCGADQGESSDGNQAGNGSGSIRVWAHQGQEGENQALRDTVTAFNSSQDDVKVQLKLIPENSYPKTLSLTPASELPDVLEFDGPTMASLVHQKKLAPLEPYVAITTRANATDASENQGTLDHELYGLGMFDSGLGLYGNKKLLEAAGVDYPRTLDEAWTAEEFATALKKLAARDSDGKVLDIQKGNGLATEWGTYGFSPIVWSAGGELVAGAKASGALDRPSVIRAFSQFQSWTRYVDGNADGDAMTKSRVALSWVGHWMYPVYSKALGEDLVIMPLPDFGEGPKTGQGSWSWGVGAETKNGRAAGKFLDFLLGDDSVKAMTKANGAPPATESVLEQSPLYKKGGPLRLFADQLASPCSEVAVEKLCVAISRPATAGYPVVTAEFSRALRRIHNGEDPAVALSSAAKAIDLDFAENNGYED